MEKHYRFAGVEITVSIPDAQMYEKDRYLAPFRVESVSDPHLFRFRTVTALDPPEGEAVEQKNSFPIYRQGEWTVSYPGAPRGAWEQAYARTAHRGKKHEIQLRQSEYSGWVGVHTVLNVLWAEHLIARSGGFIFHCSYIEYDGDAILFTAPSGTGKSTQAELWKLYRGADIVNGDRAAVRIEEGRILAEGIPFSGSSTYCQNRSLPIKAIVYLSQAPETTIRRMRGYESYARIWEGVSVNIWDQTDVELVSGAVERVVQNIPIFHLSCTADESAVTALEQVLESR